MESRRRLLPHRDGDASAVEYGAVLVLAALAAVFTIVALPDHVRSSTAIAVCRIFGGEPQNCPDDRPPAPAAEPPGANTPPGLDDQADRLKPEGAVRDRSLEEVPPAP